MTTYSMFYTGTKAHLVKRGDGDFVMQPNESKHSTRRFVAGFLQIFSRLRPLLLYYYW